LLDWAAFIGSPLEQRKSAVCK